MVQYGVSVYLVTFRDKHARDSWTSTKGGRTDTYEAVHDYLKTRKRDLKIVGRRNSDGSYSADTKAFVVQRIAPLQKHRIIAGVINYGEAGSVRGVMDLDKLKETKTIHENEAPVAPFYYRFDLPVRSKFGTLYLQSTGGIGVKSALYADLKDHFEVHGAKHGTTIRLTPLVGKQAAQAFIKEGVMREIVLVNEGSAVATRRALSRTLVGGSPLGEDDRITVTIKRKGGWKGLDIKSWFGSSPEGTHGPKELVEGVPYDDMAVRVKVGGSLRRLKIIKPDENPVKYDVSDKVELRKGHPTFTSMDRAVTDLQNTVRRILETHHIE